ncbi:MAG: 4-(cytidine 5'-diphospho)-2-C-methyl-D-erythritol kinase [Clostridiaceae bacterium]|nr:4-(cytidine 5'-diphospho)-2-C-methyl-D-erythritol kinase [Clostridiaceae bacterium]
MEIKSRAKVNITLDVVNKRDDGYHNIRMIMQTIDLYDVLYLEKIAHGIELKTNLPYLPVNKKNIAYKAARLFFDTLGIENEGIRINIKKNIPVSAGLAGGSTNAAAVLVAMNKMYGTGLKTEQLMEMGKKLGADVPYCILGGTALAEGIGDVLTPLPPIPNMLMVLAKPPVSVSTASVYKQLNINTIMARPDTEGVIHAIYNQDVKSIAKGMYNVLEEVTAKRHPVINTIKRIMLDSGALGAIMSGSGPTVFGVFEDKVSARKAVSRLEKVASDIFIVNTYNSNGRER